MNTYKVTFEVEGGATVTQTVTTDLGMEHACIMATEGEFVTRVVTVVRNPK